MSPKPAAPQERGTKSRNRGPCTACQASKRKCDQAKPQCSRCCRANLTCTPSLQARWRVNTCRDADAQARRRVPRTATAPDISPPTPQSSLASPVAMVESGTGPSQHGTPIDREDVSMNNTYGDEHRPPEIVPGLSPDSSTLSGLTQTFEASLVGAEDFFSLFFPASQFDLTYRGIFPNDWEGLDPAFALRSPSLTTATASRSRDAPTLAATDEPDVSYNISVVSSNTTNAIVDRVLDSFGESEESLSHKRVYLHDLWELFILQIAPSLTPFGSRMDNPFLKYLVPRCEKSPALSMAVLYLAQIIARRGRRDSDDTAGRFLGAKAETILSELEQDNVLTLDASGVSDDRTEHMLLTLTTVLVFCMAFIASKDGVRVSLYVEYAVIICQALYKTLAEDESFLYLAKLLGFIQNSLLFSARAAGINAPDYLGAALEFHDRNSDALCEIDGLSHESLHFRDLDMFSGLSASMASILYTLGTLIKRKKTGLHHKTASQGEWVRAFESDVDGLEVRLRRHLTLLAKRFEQHPSHGSASQQLHNRPLTRCLNSYNEAVFWSAWSIFLTDLKGRCAATDGETRDAVEHILDACAHVPRKSTTASLMLFPLAVGGMRATTKVYREFVLCRLEGLKNIGLTDTQSLCADLEVWWGSDMSGDSPIAFTSNFVF